MCPRDPNVNITIVFGDTKRPQIVQDKSQNVLGNAIVVYLEI